LTIAFRASDVSFDYQGVHALRELSLEIQQGERIALLGANGCGKSTLLRILDGLYFPSHGTLEFCGEPLSPERLQHETFALQFRRRVALVFQNPDVQLFNPTVFDEVAYGPLQLRWGHDEIVRRVDETLNFMGIASLKDRPPYRLSGGEKKKVALASVIVLDPEVLLLDEPTSTLDPRSQSQLVDLIQNWRGTAKTVVTATHQLDIVEDIADRVVVMDAGMVIASGSPQEILSDTELLQKANLIRMHRHSHNGVMHSHPHVTRHSHK
jgi:cobalt/nickel transport system ATP-binding protein